MSFNRKLEHVAMVDLLVVLLLVSMTSSSLAQGDTWTEKAPMPTARSLLSTSVVNGKIYAIGGFPGRSDVEEYDPTTDTWTTKAPMPTARQWMSTSAVNGKIYAIGGDASTNAPGLATVEEYDPATNTWTKKADMPTARFALSTSVVDGKIYAIGGFVRPGSGATGVVEAYDPAANTWAKKADMPSIRFALSTSVVDGKIYAIGGAIRPGVGGLPTVQMYDPVTDTWTTKALMPSGKATFLATSTVNGIIYVIGGINGQTALATVEAYDPATDIWTEKTSMPTARGFLGTSVVNGKIYAIGGRPSGHGAGMSTVEEYTPSGVTSVDDPSGESSQPAEFILHQNYPNPFSPLSPGAFGNPGTRIGYEVTKPGRIVIQVTNLLGQAVRTLVDEDLPAGFHEVIWDGRNNIGQRVPSGVYLYQLEGPGLVQMRKMVLMR